MTLLARLSRLMGVNIKKMAKTKAPKSPGLILPLAIRLAPTARMKAPTIPPMNSMIGEDRLEIQASLRLILR